jgi:hypothetical protein
VLLVKEVVVERAPRHGGAVAMSLVMRAAPAKSASPGLPAPVPLR